MAKFKDLTGQTFGRLKVIKQIEKQSEHTYWLCECQCENKTLKEVRGTHLTSNRIRSCGCLYKERTRSKVPPNKFEIRENYKIGYTDDNREFYYDVNDAKEVEKYSWYFDRDGYVVARINDKGVKLHKFIMKTNKKVDHKNRCKNDNRRHNLRVATNNQNGMNIKIREDNNSGVTGISRSSDDDCWRARITVEGKEIHLGYFDDFQDAVETRQNAELKYFGEYSPLYKHD
ncbi:MAG: hypothetical protein LLF98_02845 [Clostridium sp.]|uniref:hypothetical protein n=1 Tax=Clostridium sp. TaxID=1506 RepID=UPI0025C18CBC|nr:hypothetical protein [Clostridium sp.]MCE5220222.1 hypothetical protein [Clostridium sp.]